MSADPVGDIDVWVPTPAKAAPGWMITFADLLSLLLAFFVLMFSTMSVDERQWERLIAPISDYLRPGAPPPPGTGEPPVAGRRALESGYVSTLLESLKLSDPALTGAAIEHSDDRVRLRLAPAPAAHWITAERPPLAGLAGLAAGLDLPLTVSVTVPPARGADAATWEIALDGAGAVAAELQRLGVTRRPAVEGAIGAGDQAEVAIEFETPHALP
jgi:chemotaxis protein MotB